MPPRRGSTASAARDQKEPRSALKRWEPLRAGPLFVWAALQVAVIGVAATRLPLAAQYPVIGEFHASQLLLAIQLPLAMMLMPALLRTWQSTFTASFLAALLQLTASLLTDVPPIHALPSAIYVTLWVAMAGLLRWSLCESSARLTTVAGAAASLTAGGQLLIYLGVDLSSRAPARFLGGPLPSLLLTWPVVPVSAWLWLATLVGLICAYQLFFQAFLHRRRAIVN